MASQHAAVRVEQRRASIEPESERGFSPLLLAAPLVALLAGLAAQWLDFRELRVPLLVMVGLGVLATAGALVRGGGVRTFITGVVAGAATWAAAETLYVLLHVALGERFDAPRFGAQWSQALGLIGVHALFLGVPTGAAAGVLLQLSPVRRLFSSND